MFILKIANLNVLGILLIYTEYESEAIGEGGLLRLR